MNGIKKYRIILFAIIFFIVIGIVENIFSFIYGKKDNLICLFYVRKDNITGELQGEIYPIALYKDRQYTNASLDITGKSASSSNQSSSYLKNIKSFTIIEDGKKLGQFIVDKIEPGIFMCSEILIGRSKSKADGSLLSIFNSIDDSKVSFSRGYKGQKEFNYTFKWTLATSNFHKLKTKGREPIKTDIERYRKDLLNIGTNLLASYKADIKEKEIIVEKIKIFDLNYDGKPEVTAKLRKPLVNRLKIYRDGEKYEEHSNDNVYLNLWMTYKNDKAKIILSLISEEREGSWGTGHDLVGTIDINGDGIDEVVMQSSGWETVEFVIYEYRKDKLERVFKGAGFGC